MPEPQPDFNRFLKVLLRQGEPDRIPFVELFHDGEIMQAVLGESLAPPPGSDVNWAEYYHKQRLTFWHTLGYDYISLGPGVNMPRHRLASEDTADLKRAERSWVDENRGDIETREDFEKYPWPSPDSVDYSGLEIVGRMLPDGMKIISTTSGVLENVMWLMGYTPFALALHDDPQLVADMFDRIGSLLCSIYETLADMDWVGAMWLGDDMGHKHGTLIAPAHMRKYVFPWQRKLAQIAHAHGKPFLLHACGNLEEVMDDLIDYVGIDAKHSFEDVILPVAEVKRKYGDSIAILGGVDVDVLSRRDEEYVRKYTRKVIEDCAPGGGWALGSGNSVCNYIRVENFLAMMDEGRKWGY